MTLDDTPWAVAGRAAALLAVGRDALGGLALRAAPGPVRDVWLRQFTELLGEAPLGRIPLHITESRLIGGIDIAATLAAGKPIAERGLLATCDGGIVIAAMAERAQRQVAAHLCSALDTGYCRMERDGLQAVSPARLAVVALDEGLEDEAPHPALLERFALRLDLHAFSIRDVDDWCYTPAQIAEVTRVWRGVSLPPDAPEAIATTSVALGIHSPRAWLFAARATQILAALDGCTSASETHLALAMQLCLGHRATQLPPEGDSEPAPAPPEDEPQQPSESERGNQEQRQEALPDQVLDATTAAIPEALLARLQAKLRTQQRAGATGKAGQLQRQRQRGRPIGSTPGDPRRGGRLSVIDTLRAAVPWQRLRARERPEADTGIDIRKEDFRLIRFQHRSESTTIFVVDASGSAALHRLAEAKGAVELLLADCYVRRDEVALIAFRGEQAELLLPPTRSLLRAKRSLSGLPGGGGTPLASAIALSEQLAQQIQRRGASVGLVFLTDGVANISRDGSRGREQAAEDAMLAARSLRDTGVRSLVIDTSPRAQHRARRLAEQLDAVYLAMPHADANRLKVAVDQAGVSRG